MTSKELQIATGIRAINTKYFEYLYGMKESTGMIDIPSVTHFITEVTEKDAVTVLFIAKKGLSLRADIRREIIELYNCVYETIE